MKNLFSQKKAKSQDSVKEKKEAGQDLANQNSPKAESSLLQRFKARQEQTTSDPYQPTQDQTRLSEPLSDEELNHSLFDRNPNALRSEPRSTRKVLMGVGLAFILIVGLGLSVMMFGGFWGSDEIDPTTQDLQAEAQTPQDTANTDANGDSQADQNVQNQDANRDQSMANSAQNQATQANQNEAQNHPENSLENSQEQASDQQLTYEAFIEGAKPLEVEPKRPRKQFIKE